MTVSLERNTRITGSDLSALQVFLEGAVSEETRFSFCQTEEFSLGLFLGPRERALVSFHVEKKMLCRFTFH